MFIGLCRTLGFIEKISSVRSVERRRSRSVTGVLSVEVESLLSVVGAVSSDLLPLLMQIEHVRPNVFY